MATVVVAGSAACAASAEPVENPVAVGAKGETSAYFLKDEARSRVSDVDKYLIDLDVLRQNEPGKLLPLGFAAFASNFCFSRTYTALASAPLALTADSTIVRPLVQIAEACGGDCRRKVTVSAAEGARFNVYKASATSAHGIYHLDSALREGWDGPKSRGGPAVFDVPEDKYGLVIRAADDATAVNIQIGDACGDPAVVQNVEAA